MKREIKFRAFGNRQTSYGQTAREMFEPFGLKDYPTDLMEESVVMQYTGLKDKNGKEIYEDDIIKTNYRDIFQMNWRMMVVENEVEIVGNVYEDPDLLTNQ